MMIDDYGSVLALMRGEPGVSIRAADSRESIARYLDRNPGLSFVAESGGRIIGCVFGGHDGRRGSLNHLVVDVSYRQTGIGRDLVAKSLDALQDIGIYKTHIDVFAENVDAIIFWKRVGWVLREDLCRFSISRSDNPNI